MPKINLKHEPFFAVYHIYFIYNLQHIKKTEVGPDCLTDKHIYIQALQKNQVSKYTKSWKVCFVLLTNYCGK